MHWSVFHDEETQPQGASNDSSKVTWVTSDRPGRVSAGDSVKMHLLLYSAESHVRLLISLMVIGGTLALEPLGSPQARPGALGPQPHLRPVVTAVPS